ncbi:MAG: hypothetical protein WAT68_07740 [Candidatus Nitrotoga sp.]
MSTKIAGLIISLMVAFTSSNVYAHNVWAHGNFTDPNVTVDFYHKAGEVYKTRSKMIETWQEANSHLENGVISEFETKINPKKSLNPDEFKSALNGYIKLRGIILKFDEAIEHLQEVDNKGTKVKIHEETLSKILSEARPMPRLSRTGVRYSDAAGTKGIGIDSITNTTEILAAWRTDLKILVITLDEVIVGLRDALPLADKGDFASVMLSGRNAFGDKMPQFTEMFSAYQRFYVQTVMATITTTMQVYPAGYEWLNKK